MRRITRPALAAMACAILVLSIGSCDAKKAEAAKAREAYLAEARTRLSAAEASLASAGDEAGRKAALGRMLKIEVMELGELEAAFKLFDDNPKLLAGELEPKALVAVAQSMRAGREKKVEDKLQWLAKGMRSFDALGEDFPNNETVMLYQASTYASFPQEVGAAGETLDILTAMRARYASGAWKLSQGTAQQLAWIYETLERNNPSSESAKEIRSSRDESARALSLLARELEARP